MLAICFTLTHGESALAPLAAESFRRRTGLETRIIGPEKHQCETTLAAKLRVFSLFPTVEDVLIFEPDMLCIQEWEPREFAGRAEVIAVRYDARQIDVPPEQYFHTGLLILNRTHHSELLDKALHDGKEKARCRLEHSPLNRARRVLKLPALWLPKSYNWLDCELAKGPLPVVGHFRDAEKADRADWLQRGFGLRAPKPALTPSTPWPEHAAPVDPVEAEHRARLEAFVAELVVAATPRRRGSGDASSPFATTCDEGVAATARGIVICGGGTKYFPCAWVCVRMLRELGCTLPIEVWHLGEREMSPAMKSLLEPYGVTTVDALEVRKTHPIRRLSGWECKAFALLHCAFREVLLLDADNVPVRDPSYLFDEPEYTQKGAIFWPDYGRLAPDRCIWRIMGIPYRDEPEFESGQILVHKAQCHAALQLSMFLNEWSDFYYRHIHGDKDTFHMAWRKLGLDYAMPARGIQSLPATMCQHDLAGERIFQHRNFDKWLAWGGNRKIPGFQHEPRCFEFLVELRSLWHELPPNVRRYTAEHKSPDERALAERISSTTWEYHRVGHDRRPLTFQPDGTIGEGSAGCEVFWDIASSADSSAVALEVYGAEGRTICLHEAPDGVWRGNWDRFEQMPVELIPIAQPEKRNLTFS